MNNSDCFTDSDGLIWESRLERDCARASGRYLDALIGYLKREKSGKKLNFKPFKLYYAVRYSSFKNISTALIDIKDSERIYMLIKTF